jgi:integrase
MPRKQINKREKLAAKRQPIDQAFCGGVRITIQKCRKQGYKAQVVMRKGGKLLNAKYCQTIEDAKTIFSQWSTEVGNVGAKTALGVTDSDKHSLIQWRESLAPYGKTPADAVAHYLAYLDRCKASITINALCDKFHAFKRSELHSRIYLDDLNYRLRAFCTDFGKRIAADVSTDEISTWLAGMTAAPQTVKNYRRIIRTLFNYAKTLKACAENPVDGSFKPSKPNHEVGILEVKEAVALLTAAHERPDILPAIALGLFAGVRDSELKRLDWGDVSFDSGFITIRPTNAKKKSRRIIEIRPTLRAWLEPLRKISGRVWPPGSRGRALTEVTHKAAGIAQWKHNALRHSFASYGLAQWKNANALALEMGNTPKVLLENYQELVLPKDAEAFWSLTPAKVLADNVLTAKDATGPQERKQRATKAA